jgi:hypothetical protein
VTETATVTVTTTMTTMMAMALALAVAVGGGGGGRLPPLSSPDLHMGAVPRVDNFGNFWHKIEQSFGIYWPYTYYLSYVTNTPAARGLEELFSTV